MHDDPATKPLGPPYRKPTERYEEPRTLLIPRLIPNLNSVHDVQSLSGWNLHLLASLVASSSVRPFLRWHQLIALMPWCWA